MITLGQRMNLISKCDVLVIGGGTAGTVAALQAARLGAKTLLVERGTQLGGMTTTGGVAYPGLFDAWGKQIIAGLGWELVRECVEMDGGTLPDFSKIPQRHWMHQIHINPYLFAILAEEKCIHAGVEIAFYEFPDQIRPVKEGWSVRTVGFGIRRRIYCRQIIDCSGGAAVVGLLGFPRMRGPEIQPGSMLYLLENPNNPGRPSNRGGPGLPDAFYIDNADSSNAQTVTAANLAGRTGVLEHVRTTGKRLMHLQPEAAFRESHRIVGEIIITEDDYVSGRVYPDAICYAYYPVDVHKGTGFEKLEQLKPGIIPTVPLRALIPKGSSNIMIAGRSISSDRFANGGLRVQATCMAMGQAAGVTAALAAKHKTSPMSVPFEAIRESLLQHDAIVPMAQPLPPR